MKTSYRFIKQFVSFVLILVMIIFSFLFAVIPTNAATHTVDEALAWCESQVGKSLDYDGAYGPQCVDLTKYYYSYLGAPTPKGNACDYAKNSLPSGWTRVKGGTPQPGDILVYTGGYGHVAIYAGGTYAYHQNWSGRYVQKVNRAYNKSFYVSSEGVTKYYWGYIRPDFTSSSIQYTEISEGTYYIKNTSTDKYLHVANNVDENKNNVQIYNLSLDALGQQMYISKTTNGYKIRPLRCASRLINPYADTVSSGKNVNIYNDSNDSSQWWKFQSVSGGIVIRNVQNSSCVLDVKGWDAYVLTYNGKQSQIWQLQNAVRYNGNGGSVSVNYQMKDYGASLTLPTPTRSGYDFIGWNTKTDGTGTNYTPGSSYKANANITLYAQWSANTYTVSYNANGGSFAPDSQTKKHNQTLTLSNTEPTRPGYTFNGWNTMADGSGTSYDAGETYVENTSVTLYAQWKAAPVVTEPLTTTEIPIGTEAPTTTEIPTTFPSVKVIIGDLNGDGNITAADARLALRISAKLEESSNEIVEIADVNGDNKITAADARMILRVSAKLDSF